MKNPEKKRPTKLTRHIKTIVEYARKLRIPKNAIEEFLRSLTPKLIEPNNLTAEQLEGIVSDIIATF
jgi:hypothetical protein